MNFSSTRNWPQFCFCHTFRLCRRCLHWRLRPRGCRWCGWCRCCGWLRRRRRGRRKGLSVAPLGKAEEHRDGLDLQNQRMIRKIYWILLLSKLFQFTSFQGNLVVGQKNCQNLHPCKIQGTLVNSLVHEASDAVTSGMDALRYGRIEFPSQKCRLDWLSFWKLPNSIGILISIHVHMFLYIHNISFQYYTICCLSSVSCSGTCANDARLLAYMENVHACFPYPLQAKRLHSCENVVLTQIFTISTGAGFVHQHASTRLSATKLPENYLIVPPHNFVVGKSRQTKRL